jgi:hypothetical protein
VLVGLLLGAALGNKAVFLIERPDVALALWQGRPCGPARASSAACWAADRRGDRQEAHRPDPQHRRRDGVAHRRGLAMGRIGCFLAGLHDDTYGLPTSRPWGVDFGDGIPRRPTQLYEIAVVLPLGYVLHRARFATPGLAFKLFLSGYLLWRFSSSSSSPCRWPGRWAVGHPVDLPRGPGALPAWSRCWRRPPPARMTRKTRPYLFYDTTQSVCTSCLRPVEAKILIKDGQVFMDKWCPAHGTERVLVSDDADYYRLCREVYVKPPEMPQRFATSMTYGCPYDCGLCPDHMQHSCLSSSRSATTAICAAPSATRPRGRSGSRTAPSPR